MKIIVYNTLIFDCDGVDRILTKSKPKPFSMRLYLMVKLLRRPLPIIMLPMVARPVTLSLQHSFMICFPKVLVGPGLNELLAAYAEEARKGLMACEVAEGLETLRKNTPEARWLIVSGGDQDELRYIFAHCGLAKFFDGGIFGSPATKDEILARELKYGNILLPALFLGDSRYDHQAASAADIDFAFISQWTEFNDWKNYCDTNKICFYAKVCDLSK